MTESANNARNATNCLNVAVSIFKNYHTADNPHTIRLMDWLTNNKYASVVEKIRQTEGKADRDRLKATLPAITPSGVFYRRREDQLIQHSGLIQFDIDAKDNQHISNYEQLKEQLSNIKEVAYCGLSVSGCGFWGLIPIRFSQFHKQHFEALRADFAEWGIVIDPAPSNVASLRGYSFDPDAYFNPEAQVYTKLASLVPELKLKTPPRSSPPATQGSLSGSTAARVDHCLTQIEQRRLDLTADYATWFGLGCALANEFGENGRERFHRVSQFHPQYDSGETDRQFHQCLQKRYDITIATFFHHASVHGIEWKENRSSPANGVSKPKGKFDFPPGFKIVQERILEVDGLPFSWLNEKEQAHAWQRLRQFGVDPHLLFVKFGIKPIAEA